MIASPCTVSAVHVRAIKHDMVIRKRDGEYRVAHREDSTRAPQSTATMWNLKGAHQGKLKFKRPPRTIDESKSERCAYYTNDLEDAVDTGIIMREQRRMLYAARARLEEMLNDD